MKERRWGIVWVGVVGPVSAPTDCMGLCTLKANTLAQPFMQDMTISGVCQKPMGSSTGLSQSKSSAHCAHWLSVSVCQTIAAGGVHDK